MEELELPALAQTLVEIKNDNKKTGVICTTKRQTLITLHPTFNKFRTLIIVAKSENHKLYVDVAL